MALHYKLEADIELKATAEQFYRTWVSQAHQIPNASSKIQKVQVHEGDWETHGSVKHWNFTIGDKSESFKEKVELDEENKTIKFVGMEGDLFDHYKSYEVTMKVIPKGGGCVVNVVVDFEKLHEDAQDGYRYLDFGIGLIKDIGAHLVKA